MYDILRRLRKQCTCKGQNLEKLPIDKKPKAFSPPINGQSEPNPLRKSPEFLHRLPMFLLAQRPNRAPHPALFFHSDQLVVQHPELGPTGIGAGNKHRCITERLPFGTFTPEKLIQVYQVGAEDIELVGERGGSLGRMSHSVEVAFSQLERLRGQGDESGDPDGEGEWIHGSVVHEQNAWLREFDGVEKVLVLGLFPAPAQPCRGGGGDICIV